MTCSWTSFSGFNLSATTPSNKQTKRTRNKQKPQPLSATPQKKNTKKKKNQTNKQNQNQKNPTKQNRKKCFSHSTENCWFCIWADRVSEGQQTAGNSHKSCSLTQVHVGKPLPHNQILFSLIQLTAEASQDAEAGCHELQRMRSDGHCCPAVHRFQISLVLPIVCTFLVSSPTSYVCMNQFILVIFSYPLSSPGDTKETCTHNPDSKKGLMPQNFTARI